MKNNLPYRHVRSAFKVVNLGERDRETERERQREREREREREKWHRFLVSLVVSFLYMVLLANVPIVAYFRHNPVHHHSQQEAPFIDSKVRLVVPSSRWTRQ